MKENELIGCYVYVCEDGKRAKSIFKVIALLGTDHCLLQDMDVELNFNYCIIRDIEWLKTKTIVHPNAITGETTDKLIANIGKYDKIYKTL